MKENAHNDTIDECIDKIAGGFYGTCVPKPSTSTNILGRMNLQKAVKQMEEKELVSAMRDIGYHKIAKDCKSLPNGKALLRFDFQVSSMQER